MTEITEEMVKKAAREMDPYYDCAAQDHEREILVVARRALAAVAPLIEEKARREEREACAALAEQRKGGLAIAAAIRARGES